MPFDASENEKHYYRWFRGTDRYYFYSWLFPLSNATDVWLGKAMIFMP